MLDALLDKLNEQEKEYVEQGSLPQAWGILYAAPNPDDSRKQCLNCMMWASEQNRCQIHEEGEEVTADHICGYHVYGTPMPERMEHEGMTAVPPELSGLDLVEGGTSCDICAYVLEGELCSVAVGTDGKLLAINSKGCCARWDRGSEV